MNDFGEQLRSRRWRQAHGLLDVAVVSRFAGALLRAPFRGLSRLLRVDGVGERRLLAHGRVVGRGRRVGGVCGRTLAAQRLRLLDELLALGLAVDAALRNGPALLLDVLLRRAQRSLRGDLLRVLLATRERRAGADSSSMTIASSSRDLSNVFARFLANFLAFCLLALPIVADRSRRCNEAAVCSRAGNGVPLGDGLLDKRGAALKSMQHDKRAACRNAVRRPLCPICTVV